MCAVSILFMDLRYIHSEAQLAILKSVRAEMDSLSLSHNVVYLI